MTSREMQMRAALRKIAQAAARTAADEENGHLSYTALCEAVARMGETAAEALAADQQAEREAS